MLQYFIHFFGSLTWFLSCLDSLRIIMYSFIHSWFFLLIVNFPYFLVLISMCFWIQWWFGSKYFVSIRFGEFSQSMFFTIYLCTYLPVHIFSCSHIYLFAFLGQTAGLSLKSIWLDPQVFDLYQIQEILSKSPSSISSIVFT